MTITTRPTSNGRVIIESDGASAYYGGALVQGATICRISAPARVAEQYTDDEGMFNLRNFLRDVRSEYARRKMGDVRVHELREVA
jgi:hypothetical protein